MNHLIVEYLHSERERESVCVLLREREIDRERERMGEREKENDKTLLLFEYSTMLNLDDYFFFCKFSSW